MTWNESRARKGWRVGLALASAYVVVALAAVAFLLYKLTFDAVHSELSGVPLIVVALPWSLVVLELLSLFRVDLGGTLPRIAVLGACVVLNAGLLYTLGRKIASAGGAGRSAGSA